MHKLILVMFAIAAMFSTGLSQQDTSSPQMDDMQNMGRAPDAPNGIGRADVRVFDESGQPVQGANVKLESTRTDGFFCESWNTTNEKGVAVLPPIHMGSLRFIVKAKGYQTQKLAIPASSLSQPVRVTLVRK